MQIGTGTKEGLTRNDRYSGYVIKAQENPRYMEPDFRNLDRSR